MGSTRVPERQGPGAPDERPALHGSACYFAVVTAKPATHSGMAR